MRELILGINYETAGHPEVRNHGHVVVQRNCEKFPRAPDGESPPTGQARLDNAPIATMKPCGARMGDHHFLKDGILEDGGQMTSRGFDFG
jgi:hypothetical protein